MSAPLLWSLGSPPKAAGYSPARRGGQGPGTLPSSAVPSLGASCEVPGAGWVRLARQRLKPNSGSGTEPSRTEAPEAVQAEAGPQQWGARVRKARGTRALHEHPGAHTWSPHGRSQRVPGAGVAVQGGLGGRGKERAFQHPRTLPRLVASLPLKSRIILVY